MSKRNGKAESGMNAKNNGLGPVAREKYESILQARVRQCIAAQEAKIKAHRAKALKTFFGPKQALGQAGEISRGARGVDRVLWRTRLAFDRLAA